MYHYIYNLFEQILNGYFETMFVYIYIYILSLIEIKCFLLLLHSPSPMAGYFIPMRKINGPDELSGIIINDLF